MGLIGGALWWLCIGYFWVNDWIWLFRGTRLFVGCYFDSGLAACLKVALLCALRWALDWVWVIVSLLVVI